MYSVTFATAPLRRVKEKEPTKKKRRPSMPSSIGIESQPTILSLSLRLPGFLHHCDLYIAQSSQCCDSGALFLNLTRDSRFDCLQFTTHGNHCRNVPGNKGPTKVEMGNALFHMHIRSTSLTSLSVEILRPTQFGRNWRSTKSLAEFPYLLNVAD